MADDPEVGRELIASPDLVLLEIRDLVREIRDSVIHPSTLSARARTSLALGKGKTHIRAHKLQSHAAQIAAWIDAGQTQQQIVVLLSAQGVTTSDSTLSRFVRSRLMIDLEES
jgi:hypothetical protein